MSRLQRGESADIHEQARREPLLRHYREIGAPAIAAALDIDERAETAAQAKRTDGGERDALPRFLSGDYAV